MVPTLSAGPSKCVPTLAPSLPTGIAMSRNFRLPRYHPAREAFTNVHNAVCLNAFIERSERCYFPVHGNTGWVMTHAASYM